MIIRKVGDEFSLEFAYNKQLIESLKKRLPNRRFDWDSKRWFIPAHDADILKDFAQRWGFEMNYEDEPQIDFTIQPLPDLNIHNPLS